MKRIWVYPRGHWMGHAPHTSADEYGRRTIVLPIPLGPAVVIALWTCRCEYCDGMRAQTAIWDAYDAEQGGSE